MSKALVISLNFHPGHVSHMVASYRQLEELGYEKYDPYKYQSDEEPYGVQEYNIDPEVKIDGQIYNITNTEYFKNKVELLETRKRLKALIASSEFQSCFLRQIASHFEEENLKKE